MGATPNQHQVRVRKSFFSSDEYDLDSDLEHSGLVPSNMEHALQQGLMKKRGQISMGEFFNTLLGRDHKK